MKLDRQQIHLFSEYLKYGKPLPPEKILDALELGFWLTRPISIQIGESEFVIEDDEPVFISGSFKLRLNALIIEAFKTGALKFLLVRIENSWQCYMECNGEVIENTCDEHKQDEIECVEGLRMRCGRF